MIGVSQCRNEKLANIFYKLKLIEAYGTGISKIISSYKDSIKKPIINATYGAFQVVLPNLNFMNNEMVNKELIKSVGKGTMYIKWFGESWLS